MRERAHTFGPENGMVGVETLPAEPNRNTAVILLNAGVVHRAGPYRIFVDLARRLAKEGFPVFRFDQSGVGDSGIRAGVSDLETRIVSDIRDAADFFLSLTRRSRLVVMGLCSGAVNAHLAAVRDERIVGAALFDGYAYPTPAFRVRHYGPRIADPRRLAKFVVRQARDAWDRAVRHDGREETPPEESNEGIYLQEQPARERVEADLRTLMIRGVRLFFLYTGDMLDRFNYPEQHRDAFPDVDWGDRMQVQILPQSDHTLTLVSDRDEFFRLTTNWLISQFD